MINHAYATGRDMILIAAPCTFSCKQNPVQLTSPAVATLQLCNAFPHRMLVLQELFVLLISIAS
jgi:hypothetical protein